MPSPRQALVVAALALAAPGLAAQGAVAVVGFETEGSVGLRRDDYPALGMALAATLASALEARRARVVVLAPIAPDRTGHLDLAEARRQASRAGATLVAVGQLIDQYGDIHLELRLVDAATGEPVAVVPGDEAHHNRDALGLAVGAIANLLTRREAIGGTEVTPVGVPLEALLQFGRGLRSEADGEGAQALEFYRKALELAPGFSAPATARRRAGG